MILVPLLHHVHGYGDGLTGLGGRGLGHGLGHLGSIVAHSVLWSVVSRLVWSLPGVALVGAALAAAAFVLLRPGRGSR